MGRSSSTTDSADGGLEDAVALSCKLSLRLGDGLAGGGAVDGKQVGDAGLILFVELHAAVSQSVTARLNLRMISSGLSIM